MQQKTFDAAIGDLTITADRLQYVDFTTPFVEPGFAMIVPAKPTGSAWMFTKPCTLNMWVMTGVILMYTTFAHSVLPGAPVQFRIYWPMEESNWHCTLAYLLISVFYT